MQINVPSTTRVGLKYGIYVLLGYIIADIVMYMLFKDADESQFFSRLKNKTILYILLKDPSELLNLIIFSAGISYGMLEFRRGNKDNMTYLQGLNLGLIVSAVFGICISFIQAFEFALKSPEMVQKLKKAAITNLEVLNYTAQQIEQSKFMLDFRHTPTGVFAIMLLNSMLIGCVITLLMGLFMRQKVT